MEYQLYYKSIFGTEAITNIETCLDALIAETQADYSLLIDKSGEVVSVRGNYEGQNVTGLGALMRGAFARDPKIVHMLRERNIANEFYQGKNTSILKDKISDEWSLIVVFNNQVQLGLVRTLTRSCAEQLSQILESCRIKAASNRDGNFIVF